jgi:hypothetical protein
LYKSCSDPFYESNGFAMIPDETRRLFLPIATALQVLATEKKAD